MRMRMRRSTGWSRNASRSRASPRSTGSNLPALAEGPYFDVERPGGPVLMRSVKNLVGDGRRLDEEAVGPILEALARPRHVDHRVDDDIGDMHALRSHVACDRLGQDALRRLGRREAGKAGTAPQCRRIAR